jgi:hypothetical protein
MENKIDYVITLDDNTKYMILDQGNYDGKSYFFTSRIDENDNLTNDFNILEETVNNEEITVKTVEEADLLEALAEYFKERFTVVA